MGGRGGGEEAEEVVGQSKSGRRYRRVYKGMWSRW